MGSLLALLIFLGLIIGGFGAMLYLGSHTSFNDYYKSVFSGRMYWLRRFRDGAGGTRKEALRAAKQFAETMPAPVLQSPFVRKLRKPRPRHPWEPRP